MIFSHLPSPPPPFLTDRKTGSAGDPVFHRIGKPETNRRRQPLSLWNKASAFAFTLLALSFIPAQHASAQAAPDFGSASIPNQTYTQGTTIPNLTLPAATGGAAPLTYSIEGASLPVGLTFDADTRVLQGTPTENQLATHTYTVTDSAGATDTLSLRINVQTVFTFTVPPNRTLSYTVGTPIPELTLAAVTGGAPPLSYFFRIFNGPETNLPDGLRIDSNTRVLSGTPTTGQPQIIYSYLVRDSNGLTTPSLGVLLITITDPTQITFAGTTIPNAEFTRNRPIADLTLPAATSGNMPIAYTLPGAAALGLNFDAGTRVVSGMVTSGTLPAESTHIRYTATDADGETASLPWTIRIEANTTPTFGSGASIPDQTFTINEDIGTVSFPIATEGNFAPTLSITPALPMGLDFVRNPRNPRLRGTPTEGAASATYTYSVTDGDGETASLSFTLEVLVPPITFGTTTIPDAEFTRNRPIADLTLPEATAVNPPVAYTLPDAAALGLNFDAGTRVVSGMVTSGTLPAESTDITYTATAADGETATLPWTIRIEADTTPTFGSGASIPDQTFTINEDIGTVSFPIATEGNFAPTLSITPALPMGLDFVRNPSNPRLRGTPTEGAASATYTYSVTDGDGETASLSFTLEVLVPPVTFGTTTIPNAEFTRNRPIADLTLPEATAVNPPVAYTLPGAAALGLNFDTGTRVVSGMVTSGTLPAESTDITYTATDADGETATLPWTIRIEADTTPTFGSGASIPDQTFTINEDIGTVSFPIATEGNFAPTLSITPALPMGLNFAANPRNPRLRGTPMDLAASATYTYTATDADGNAASLSFTLEVLAPPQITFGTTTIPDAEFTRNRPISPVTLPQATTAVNPPVAYTLPGAAALGLNFDTGTRVVSGMVTSGTLPAESTDITYTATDAGGETDTLPWTINVQANTTPTFGNGASIPDQTFTINVDIGTVSFPIATEGNFVLTPSVDPALPTGLDFAANPRNPRLRGTPTALAASAIYTYSVTDGDGETVSLMFTLEVLVPPITFGTTTIPDAEFTRNRTIADLTLPEATAVNPPVAYTLPDAAALGLNFDAGTRVVSGMVTSGTLPAESTDITYTATAADGETATLPWTIRIEADTTPTFGSASIAHQTFIINVDIGEVNFPIATEGNFVLTPSVDPHLPTGLDFVRNPNNPRLRGTPTALADSATYTYTATDADGDTASLMFTLEVLVPPITVTFGGDTGGAVTEDTTLTATGTLILDASRGSTEVVAQTDTNGTYGMFSIVAASGAWTYTLNNNASATNALAEGATVNDVFTVAAAADPGATTDVTITITGANDAPTAAITAPTGSPQVQFGTAVTLTGSGTDPDAGDSLAYAWTTNPPNTGSFADATVASTTWTAPASGTNPVTLILTVTDDATTPLSGTAQVTVNPVTEPIVITGANTGSVVEDATATTSGTLTLSNPGSGGTDFVARTNVIGTYGTFSIVADTGAWTYALNNANSATNALAEGATVDDVFTVAAAADPTVTEVVTITITGANDAPVAVISAPPANRTVSHGGQLAVVGTGTDPDAGETASLSYTWSTTPASTGSFADSTAASTTWTAPATGASVILNLLVSDATASATATVTITLVAATANIDGNAAVNHLDGLVMYLSLNPVFMSLRSTERFRNELMGHLTTSAVGTTRELVDNAEAWRTATVAGSDVDGVGGVTHLDGLVIYLSLNPVFNSLRSTERFRNELMGHLTTTAVDTTQGLVDNANLLTTP